MSEAALKEQRLGYLRDGFTVLDLHLSDSIISRAKEARGPEQPAIYNYSGGHRWFETWKTSQAVRDIAYSPVVLDAIRDITGLSARPFQCILFDRPSAQPLHHDAAHFSSHPRNLIIGCWTALERMDRDNGPLCYVPGSHDPGFMGWQEMGLKHTVIGGQEGEYRKYESAIQARYDHLKVPFLCERGQAFLWGIDLLHGGWPIADATRTRWSLVTHYYLDGIEYAYAPMFGPKGHRLRKSGRWFDASGALHELSEPSP